MLCDASIIPLGGRWVTTVTLLALVSLSACAANRDPSRTPRTAIEQLLLTQAAQRSLGEVSLPIPGNTALFIVTTGLTRMSTFLRHDEQEGLLLGPLTDLGYVQEVVAGRLGELGFRVVTHEEKADYVVKIMVQALGTEQGHSLVGLPQISVAGFALPEVALYKAQNQIAHMRFFLDIYDRRTGGFIRSTPTYTGDAYHNQYTILFIISFRRTDLIQAP